MRAVAAYMAYKKGRGDGNDERRNNYDGDGRHHDYDGAESRRYNDGGRRQPNQYTTRNDMNDDWGGMDDRESRRMPNLYPRGGMDGDRAEMRRRRDKKGRFMDMDDDDDDSIEDARAYDARNEYRPPMDNYGRAERWRKPDYPIAAPKDGLYDGGSIGFGTRDREYQTRSHYGGEADHGGGQAVQAGGTFWMMPQGGHTKLDRETVERWVRGMRNEDSARPSGGKWTMEELTPMAKKFGIDPDPENEEFLEWYAMTNAMYSDYCGVAKKFNITSPEFYGLMAKAWREDKDAMPGKTALYYEHIVKKNGK